MNYSWCRISGSLGASVSVAALALSSVPAAAASQDAPARSGAATAERGQAAPDAANGEGGADDATIVVTGSRIRRAGFDTLQPAIVQDRAQIEQRAATNIGDVLSEQPGFGVPTAPIGTGQEGTNVGQSRANYLGLGTARTLTLVNGKRFVSSNNVSNVGSPGLQVDLNTIPLALVDRVETIAVGGAPIYGADAIAGTVNIILKTKYEGISAAAQMGISPEYGDAEEYRASVVAGTPFHEGRGNITASLDYTRSNGLVWADRPKTAGRGYMYQSPAGSYPFGLKLYENARIVAVNQSGLPLVRSTIGGYAYLGNGVRLNPSDPASPFTQFDATGNLVPYDAGARTGNSVFGVGGDGKNIAFYRPLANDVERFNANLFTAYDLGSNVRLRTELWFAHTKSALVANEGSYQATVFQAGNSLTNFGRGPVPVLLSNPFVTSQTRATIARAIDFNNDGTPDNTIDTNGDGVADAAGFFIDRNFAEIQDGQRTTATQTLYRLVGALEGKLDLGGSTFDWDISAIYGRARSTAATLGILRSRFNQAVNAVRDPATGNIVCADRSNGCVPLNPMIANIDPAAAAFVTANDDPVSVNTQFLVSANISGPLFALPAGEVKAGLGAEYREEKARFDPSEPSRLGLFDSSQKPVAGRFSTKEIYGELLVPLVDRDMDVPLVHRLELEGAARLVKNSVAGSDVTWTAGARYQPIRDIELRGNYTRSIRAPSITELFLPEVTVGVLARDPCDARFITQGNFPSRRAANCAAAGIAQPFLSRISDASQFGTSSGNPNLNNEQANSWSVGAILRPTFMPGFELSADWIDIRIKNGIESVGGETLLQACYDSASYPDEPVCDSFTRSANGQIATISTGYVNVGSIEYAGLNVTANYQLDLASAGALNLRLDYIYVDDLTFTIGAQNPRRRVGEVGNSRHRVNASLGWTKGPFSFVNQVRWMSGTVFDTTDSPTTRDVASYPAWWTANSSISYDVRKDLTLQVNVDNIFDRRAPRGSPVIFGSNTGGLVTYYDGIRGRYATVTARIKF